MEITQVIYFNNELDLLEANIVEAQEYAQRIIVKEAARDWMNRPKPLYATENWDRYKKYRGVEVMVIPEENFVSPPDSTDPQVLKHSMRRNEGLTFDWGFKECARGSEYVAAVAADEIFDSRRWDLVEAYLRPGTYDTLCILQDNFNLFLNYQANRRIVYRIFKAADEFLHVPKGHPRTAMTEDEICGWHFSTCGPGDSWGDKYKSMPHLYGMEADWLETLDWASMRKDFRIPKHGHSLKGQHGTAQLEVDLDYYPKFIRENPELFPWCGGTRFLHQ